jgi:hypothetical protein
VSQNPAGILLSSEKQGMVEKSFNILSLQQLMIEHRGFCPHGRTESYRGWLFLGKLPEDLTRRRL